MYMIDTFFLNLNNMLQAWAEPGTNHNAKKHNHTKRHDFKIYTVYFFIHPTKKLVIIITPPRVQFDILLLHTTYHIPLQFNVMD